MAQMAQDGLARTVSPVHTSVDGDVVFAASVGGRASIVMAPDVVGAWAARVTAEAVLRGVREARGVPGVPAASDLG
jgi:L-aminopeptidase/D-esterase-like protein